MGVELGLSQGTNIVLRVFETRMARKIFGPVMKNRLRNEERYLLYLSIIRVSKPRRTGSVGVWRVWRRREMYAGFWRRNL
jgi:hypothetical protein